MVQVSLIIIYSTGHAPFPRLSALPHSSHTPIATRRPGVPSRLRSTPPLSPPGGADHGSHGVPGGKDRRGESKGDGRMRGDRDERRERRKNTKYTIRTHCRLVLNQVRGSHSRCHVMVLDIFGGRPDTHV